MRTLIGWLGLLLVCTGSVRSETTPLKLTANDRVVFLGSTLVERDQQTGYFETMLHAAFPQAAFTFRNLGWSGDNVWGDARAEFGTQAEGYQRLIGEVISAKPTVLIVCYGTNESFRGESGIAGFIKQYETLLNDLAKTQAKVWLMGPNHLEKLAPPLPDPTAHNGDVDRYSDAIKTLAAKRGAGFISLADLRSPDAGTHLTDDEMQFNPYGARQFAAAAVRSLCATPAAKEFDAAWEAIRLKTVAKNREFFYRWRPQNDTYIFGFRKHEQGQNAVEIPQFDPIVKKLEAEIFEMKKSLSK